MKKIHIFDKEDLRNKTNPNRYATRAVIFKDNKILLLYLTETKEFKFPGGGVEKDESFDDALIREAKEEAGVNISNIKSCLGYIDQIYPDKYNHTKTFYMRSIYYICEISNNYQKQNLSKQEISLGFTPKWVSLEEAIKTNQTRLNIGSNHHWTKRELYMLKYLKENY
ncbi:NUDIX hydrolase [Candidatus Izemoplasma sp. B36]|uniref:NUDIX hydrolase n=1 Tax=Candidatus Izemoplasma sp. B36 TaxID=3242468 RepID=UPI003556EF14